MTTKQPEEITTVDPDVAILRYHRRAETVAEDIPSLLDLFANARQFDLSARDIAYDIRQRLTEEVDRATVPAGVSCLANHEQLDYKKLIAIVDDLLEGDDTLEALQDRTGGDFSSSQDRQGKVQANIR